MRRRVVARVAVVTLLWAPIVVLASGFARGVGVADFSGYDMGAKAIAAQYTFNQPSLGIPARPTGEMDVAYSEAMLQSGPAGYGLGSVVWPGQVAAAVPGFIQGEFHNGCQCEFPFMVPNYPVRAESFHPQGPASSSQDIGSASMRSSARETLAEGVAYMNSLGFPGVSDVGTQSSLASSGFEPDGAVSLAEASADDIDLIAGLIKIDSVVTRASARSDGEKAAVAGTTTVTGATVGGTGVLIDSSGVHVPGGQGIGTTAAQQAVNQALAGAGVSMEVAPPVDTVQGPSGSRSLGGLLVRIKASAMESLIAALPDAMEKEIRDEITFDQETTIQFAPAVVKVSAAKALPFTPIDELPDVSAPTGGDGGGGGGTTTETEVGGGSEAAPSGGGEPSSGIGGPVAIAPVRSSFGGIPLWFLFGLALVALATSRPLIAWADRVLASGEGAGSCPLERD